MRLRGGIGMKTNPPLRHQLAAEVIALATTQHGVVATRQLLAFGYSGKMIRTDVEHGRLIPVHKGVYRVGHKALPEWSREMAAVLACGTGSYVSHWDAAILHGMLKRTENVWPVHVSVTGRRRKRPGIKLHWISTLDPLDRHEEMGVPVTSPARTLLDLAGVATKKTLQRATNEARIREIIEPLELIHVLDRYRRRPGAEVLRDITDRLWHTGFTRSGAEDSLHELIENHNLPSAKSNTQLHGLEVDALWEAEGLIVEVDGEPFHGTPDARESDEARDRFLADKGFRVLRFTSSDLREVPGEVADTIRSALRDRRLSLNRPLRAVK